MKKNFFHCSEYLSTLENCQKTFETRKWTLPVLNGLIYIGDNQGHTIKQNYIFYGGFSSRTAENTLEMYSVFVS